MFSNTSTADLSALAVELQSHPRKHGSHVLRRVTFEGGPTTPVERRGFVRELVSFASGGLMSFGPLGANADWTDLVADPSEAAEHLIESLSVETLVTPRLSAMPRDAASGIFQRLDSLVPGSARFYARLGIGLPGPSFCGGIAVVGAGVAAVLLVVDSPAPMSNEGFEVVFRRLGKQIPDRVPSVHVEDALVYVREGEYELALSVLLYQLSEREASVTRDEWCALAQLVAAYPSRDHEKIEELRSLP